MQAPISCLIGCLTCFCNQETKPITKLTLDNGLPPRWKEQVLVIITRSLDGPVAWEPPAARTSGCDEKWLELRPNQLS